MHLSSQYILKFSTKDTAKRNYMIWKLITYYKTTYIYQRWILHLFYVLYFKLLSDFPPQYKLDTNKLFINIVNFNICLLD